MNEVTLWYRRPAEHWKQALPVGNGRLGRHAAAQQATHKTTAAASVVRALLRRRPPRGASA